MDEGSDPVDPARLRVSHADRDRVAEVLRVAAGEGRLEIEELEERLEQAYAAKTYADLVPLTLDLPGAVPTLPTSPSVSSTPAPGRPPSAAGAAAGARPTYESSVGVMSGCRRAGPWVVGDRHSAFAMMGSVVLDLREALLGPGEVEISASAVMGSVEIVVDDATEVHVAGVGVMGSFQERRRRRAARPSGGGPRVRVTGLALMGSVEVVRRGPRRRLTGR